MSDGQDIRPNYKENLLTELNKLSVSELLERGYREAACDRIEELQAELDKYRWIPVSERLPEKTVEDLRPKYPVYNEDGLAVQEWRHYDFGWEFSGETGNPTHWMDIPILPESEA